ncbi:MAG TPA: AIPR family protein [Dehalococcoidia bacterium]|nr:AIPR family protein [Dehalococcoidia bacterium]
MPTYTLRVHPDRVRTIEDPSFPDMKTVYALVDVFDLPATDVDGHRKLLLSMAPDPRVPRPSAVTKEISRSLATWDGTFHLLNRGITISAQAADYDNQTKLLTLVVPDEDRYGILDGGHTTHSIETVIQAGRPEGLELRPQFVRLEILIGAEDYLGDIARARNTSMQVKLFSLKNKAGEFQWLKSAVSPYDSKIRWSENDPQEFPVLELIQILAACNALQFGPNNHPIEAYKNSGKCLDYLLEPTDRYGYRRLAPVAKDVWKLYDTIRYKWWDFYNKPHPVTGKPGRAGRLAEVRERKRRKASLMQYVTLHVQGDPAAGDKHVEKGLAFPALAGFRLLLEEGPDGNLRWKTDPFAFFEKYGVLLVRTVMDASDSRDNNPHIVGRDATVYDLVYRTIESELTKVENEQLRAQLAQHEKVRV